MEREKWGAGRDVEEGKKNKTSSHDDVSHDGIYFCRRRERNREGAMRRGNSGRKEEVGGRGGWKRFLPSYSPYTHKRK